MTRGKYYLFLDESYDLNSFVLALVWTGSLREVVEVKKEALRKIGKESYKFHFSDDREAIREAFIGEILSSPLHLGVVIFDAVPKTCRDYAVYYVSVPLKVLPVSNSIVYVYVKGLKSWLPRDCDLLREAPSLGWHGNAVVLRLSFGELERAGLEVADYLASLYRRCLARGFEGECGALGERLEFVYRWR